MKTALITGGTSGIGLALVSLFKKDDWRVIVVARSKSMPKNSPKVIYIQQDLSKSGAAERVKQQLDEKEISIDALVNNAGFGQYGAFTDISQSRHLAMIQLNIIALTELTQAFLPDIIKRKGKILNIASTAAFAPGPFMGVYFATKHYVLAFSEALREELDDKGVVVTTLCPGPTKTNFDQEASAAKTSFFSGNLPTAEEVALYGYDALKRGEVVAVHGPKNKFQIWLIRFLPRSVIRKIMRRSLTPRK